MEHPKLNLGSVGFSASQRMALATMLLAYQNQNRQAKPAMGHPVWQLTDYREANALILNLARSEEGPDQILRFYSDPSHPNPIGVTLSDLSVPFAVAHLDTQLPKANLVPEVHAVDVDSYASVLAALQRFETVLQPLLTVFAFAQHIQDRGSDLDIRQTYRLVQRTGMLALIDLPQHTVWLRDGTAPHELNGCIWQTNPATQTSISEGFTPWTLEETYWIFAQYCHQAKLPKRYLEHPIFFRRRLRVRPSLVYPRQLELLEQLGRKPLRYEDFQGLPSVNMQTLEHDLYALYMCRAITTDPRKVFNESARSGHSSHSFGPSSQATGAHDLPPIEPTVPVGLRTAPAELS
jgi:hypothetical protein